MRKLIAIVLLVACATVAQAQQPTPEQIESKAYVESLHRKLTAAQDEAARMEAVATRLAARVRELEAAAEAAKKTTEVKK